ncbi:MAG: hypothetical protein ABRQ37_14480 [Candidatus Eremiobacterota bacterium]
MVKQEEMFKDICYRKNSEELLEGQDKCVENKPYIPGIKGAVLEHRVMKNIFFEKNPSCKVEIQAEPSEVIERRRYRELKEDFNKKLFNNADRITSVAKPLIISLVVSSVIDLFYWVLAFTPHAGYMWFVGNICTLVQILSAAGLVGLFLYSFFTGRRITRAYDRLFETFDKNLVAEIDYL